MESTCRFEILNTIASGDFATVYRARDQELGREVAIKQIHPQFLSDPGQLDRYWREAQLLASLPHPNVLTVYDIVRTKGWLILELLRGNLQRTARTAPLDLPRLRIVMLCGLNGLRFLHANEIIHGDVKPSNLLVDARGRVKLGDFGLARRASDEHGSLLKGTTKYMAPELISDQFGPVGPASDLYALGFSAYELMCGPQFETLFPGLHTFGRDRQTAWLMWHAAPDRHLPAISRVLEGVPENLARIIERLVAKDPSKRYQTAQEALDDLRIGQGASPLAASPPPDHSPPPEKGKRRRRAAVLCALASSVMLAVCMLLPSPSRPVDTREPQAVEGVIRMIDADRRILVLDLPDGDFMEIPNLKPDDRFFINDKRALLGELQRQDRVALQYVHGEDGRKIAEVYATRPQMDEGKVTAVDAETGTIAVTLGTSGTELSLRVPGTAKILFNGQEDFGGRPATLADLRAGDHVRVRHVAGPSGSAAVALAAQRLVTLRGVIRGIELPNRSLTFETGEGKQASMRRLAFAPECSVRLNDRSQLEGRVLSVADLKPGDRATIAHDTRVVSIDATRVLRENGVVQSVQPQAVIVQIEGQPQPRSFQVHAACEITLAGEPAELGDLRRGDLVEMSHDGPSPRTTNAHALAMVARRPEQPTRWAIVIGVEHYDDASIDDAPTAAADAQLVRDALVKRHAVPAEQALTLTDPSRVRLEQGIASLLERVQATDQLIVYYAGRALRDADGTIYLAPKEFRREQAPATGLSLQALAEQLDACPAREKILLLDSRPAVLDDDRPAVPSSADMLDTLRPSMRTLVGIATVSRRPPEQPLAEGKAGRFATSIADGFGGQADQNRDGRLETTELVAFLNAAMAAARPGQGQAVKLFLPDYKPPRLSEGAKQSIRELAGLAAAGVPSDASHRNTQAQLTTARAKLTAAQDAAGMEPEPKLLYGLILLRAHRWDEAAPHFEVMRLENSELTLPRQGLVWTHFCRRDYTDGMRHLVDLVDTLKKPKMPGETYPAEAQQIFAWAGRLREFAARAVQKRMVPRPLLQKLDAAVATRGEAARSFYQKGRDAAEAVLQDFDAQIASTDNAATKIRSQFERRKLDNYAAFPFDTAIQTVLSRLDR